MATVTKDHHHHNLHLDSLSLIDLRLLSQSELLSLSHCSSRTTTANTNAHDDDEDEVSTPKIDRSVFNESAGSRKQTFSRFRLAPRNSSQIPPQFPSVAPPEPLDGDNFQIISLLKSLLKIQSHSSYTIGNNGQLIPVQVHYKDDLNATSNFSENKGLHNVPVDVVTLSVKKRKRGRPRKDESRLSDNCWVIESESKVGESKGESNEIKISVNIVACESIKRRRGRPRKDENRIRNEYRVIESENKVIESKGETNEIKVNVAGVENLQNIPVNVVACENGKRRPGRPRKGENRNINKYRVIECDDLVNESKVESNEIKVTLAGVESLQNIPVNVVACENGKRRRGRPRKDENRTRNEYGVMGSESLVNENKSGSSEIKVAVVSVKSSQNFPVNVVAGETSKRRRGRPRKDESRNRNEYGVVGSGNKVVQSVSENKEAEKEKAMVMENRNGVAVDLVALGNVKDPFAEEFRKRTAGIEKKEELLGFLSGLKGHWVSRRQKRKIVDASEFGDALPRGWKLMLCIKKKVGHVWLACRRYISPNGQQFASCKEVSSYLHSLFGLQDAGQSYAGHTGDVAKLDEKMTSENAADPIRKDDKNGTDFVFCSPILFTPKSIEHEKQATFLKTKSPGEVERQETLNCHKCSMTFPEQDDLLHHLLTSHQVTTKKSRCSASISEGVIIKDGKYECQLCHKLFEERHRYNGHLGGHMKNYVKRLGGVLTTQKNNETVSVGVPSEFLERQDTVGVDWDSFARKSSNCRANNEITSTLPYGKSKPDGSVETHSDKHIHDEQIMMSNRNVQILVDENCNKQDRISSIITDKVEKVKAATVVSDAKSDVCLGAGIVLSTNHGNKLCGFSGERDVPKSNIAGISNLDWQGRSPQNWSLALAGSDQPRCVDYSVKGVPISSMEEQRKDIGPARGVFSSNGKEKIFSFENLEERHFTSTMEGGEIDRNKYARDEAISGSVYGCTGFENAVTGVKEQESFKGFSPLPMEQRRGSESNMNGVSTSMLAEARQERGPASGLPTSSANKPTYVVNNYLNTISTSMLDQPQFDDVNRSENNELSFVFGNKHTVSKPQQEEDSEVGLLNLFGSEKIFGFDNSLTKVSAGATGASKLHEVRSSNEQGHGVENNYRVYTGTGQQESRLENSESARNNDFLTAFSNHGRSGVDVMAELFWRTDEENILLSGLTDASSRLLPSSGCFPAFGTMSDKGESELFNISEKFDSVSGFEGLRSGSIEHMEYDFLTTQTSSHSEVPKALSYDHAEMSRGFDSSVWLEKEALPLLPKIGSRYQVATVCAWCRNEFHHEPVDSGAETGSVGFMCPTCKAKFSSNHGSL